MKKIFLILFLFVGLASSVNYLPETAMKANASFSMDSTSPGDIEMWGGSIHNASIGAATMIGDLDFDSGYYARNATEGWCYVGDYGAIGDGITNDTAAIQAAVDACPTNGYVVGNGGTYLVKSIYLKSNMTLAYLNLETLSGSEDFSSPVTIGGYGNTSLFENINIIDVHINGNRTGQTSIGATEDGGRHGIRIIGHVNNVMIDRCSATHCASDGICLYQGIDTHGTGYIPGDPLITNITIRDSEFTWNRRHGMSGDSLDSVNVIRCKLNNNGHDINGGILEGDQGARFNGDLYANGADIEGYDINSTVTRLTFFQCQAMQNVRSGILVYNPVNRSTVGFQQWDQIRISYCEIDDGTNTSWKTAISLFPVAGSDAVSPRLFNRIAIDNCILTGYISIKSANFAPITDTHINPNGYPQAFILVYVDHPILNNVNITSGTLYYSDNGEPKIIKAEYYASAAPTSMTWRVGDITWNKEPSTGEYVGWICTVAGTPGTWKGFGAIAA